MLMDLYNIYSVNNGDDFTTPSKYFLLKQFRKLSLFLIKSITTSLIEFMSI